MISYSHTGIAKDQAERLIRYWTMVRGWHESESFTAAATFSPTQLQRLCDRLDRVERTWLRQAKSL